ncbi:F0F1 ATP synthase subunit delta [Amnimonas aquatica]|uniref:ATP synthase subunit delta n=1 Tax=Amnimonas aquatica TaxID=2094561 RepID=A0A2P6AUV2_9GAMM|nr:F0F1 ATP synthase subunit delta [Amnimonas aquatica]PQA51099.1 F0F1 ATP synthase subunit delta [Amnimonas aquatica]
MAELTTVARPYAKAAFEHARGKGQLAAWSSMLALAAAVVDDAAFKQYIARPTLGAAEQADAVLKVVGDRLDDDARNFISNLAANKRLAALPAISSLFEALRAEAEGAVDVEVTAAYALDDAQTQALARTLTEKLARQVNVSSGVDASLIGGAVIRAGDLVIDASVRGKLGKLRATLNT